MNILNFMQRFPDEASCIAYLKEQREQSGIVCKLRDAMGKRDGRYRLCGQVELDEGFFTIELPQDKRDEPLKRGHGSQKKAKVLVMIESAPSQKNPGKGRPSKTVGHLKMQVIPDLKSETITKIVKEQPEPSVELTTDDSTSYVNIRQVSISNYKIIIPVIRTKWRCRQSIYIKKRSFYIVFIAITYSHRNRHLITGNRQ